MNNENFIDTKKSYPGIKDVCKWVQYNQSRNYNDQSNHKLNIKKNNPTIDIQFNENFFLIGTKNFIKKKIANPSALEKYFGGENQEPKLQ